MTEKKRKFWYWYLKIFSVLVACGLPIYAVSEHFPLWKASYGTSRSIGAGAIISLIIIVLVFRKSVFEFMRDKLNLRHAPPLVIPLIMLIVSYILLYINQFIRDLTTVFWFWLAGCAVGTALTFIAENVFGKKKEDGDG
jgi:membrane protease YdiL (CAAX protease family)